MPKFVCVRSLKLEKSGLHAPGETVTLTSEEAEKLSGVVMAVTTAPKKAVKDKD